MAMNTAFQSITKALLYSQFSSDILRARRDSKLNIKINKFLRKMNIE